MNRPKHRIEGRCRCGRVRFEITARPLLTMACHCTGCQRMASSAYSLSAMIPAGGFSVLEGEPVLGGAQQSGGGHYFCGFCMSWLFTRPDDAPIVNVRPTMLEHAEWSTPFIEMFTREKLDWATTPAVHSFGRFPEWSDFKSLMQEFADQISAPPP